MDNVLAAGRSVAWMIGAGALAGQVAGTAAARAVKERVAPGQLDVAALRETLKAQARVFAAQVP